MLTVVGMGPAGLQWLIPAARGAWELGHTTWARKLQRRAGDRLLQGEIELRDGEPAVAAHELLTAAETLPPGVASGVPSPVASSSCW